MVERAREGQLLRLTLGEDRWRLVERMQSAMSLIEGHAEHTMDAVGAEVLPSLPRLRAAMSRRRENRGLPWRVLERLLGPRAEAAPVRDRQALLRRGRGGRRAAGALACAWSAPEALPSAGGARASRPAGSPGCAGRIAGRARLSIAAAQRRRARGRYGRQIAVTAGSETRYRALWQAPFAQIPNACSACYKLGASRCAVVTVFSRVVGSAVTISGERVTNMCSPLTAGGKPRTLTEHIENPSSQRRANTRGDTSPDAHRHSTTSTKAVQTARESRPQTGGRQSQSPSQRRPDAPTPRRPRAPAPSTRPSGRAPGADRHARHRAGRRRLRRARRADPRRRRPDRPRPRRLDASATRSRPTPRAPRPSSSCAASSAAASPPATGSSARCAKRACASSANCASAAA